MHMSKLNLKGLEFPMKVSDIPKFESLDNLNVNVFGLNGNLLIALHKNRNYDQTQIDSMLYENKLLPKYKVALFN